MQKSLLDLKVLFFLCFSLTTGKAVAQLGFCQGNSGDPIFVEDFGIGIQDTSLPAGTTTYTYANGQPPDDGLYTVSSNSNYFDWFDVDDHTPNDTNGRMLIINSDFTSGEFYRATISGLCENTTYEFSSWMINLSPSNGFCSPNTIPINVRFEIWDSSDTNLLASGDTGDITSTITPEWDQYALVFQSNPGQTSVILKMLNNGSGGCGNDLALDDIVFKSCGDSIIVEDSVNANSTELCASQVPFSDTITATPDNVVFSEHFYQWQISTDGTNWSDITGETNETLIINGITTTTYFRAKVAEFAANLNDADCITFSDVYTIIVNEVPPQPNIECWETITFDDTLCDWIVTGTQPNPPTDLECWETATFNNTSCTWEVTGSQPEMPELECWETTTFNNDTCEWDIIGTQPEAPTDIECWETPNFNNDTCSWEVSGTQPEPPQDLLCWQSVVFNDDICDWEIEGTQPIESRDEFVSFCEGGEVTLFATSEIVNPQYLWDSGEITSSITVDMAGSISVEVTDGCLTDIITFTVTEIEIPEIESITTDGRSIIVNVLNNGDYQYSLDGVNYQSSNTFNNLLSGLYTIYVKSSDCDFVIFQDHIHFYIQKFITPNGDGDNDFFIFNVAPFFTSSEVYIFDRYGKQLYSAINSNVFWDGTYNGSPLPASDYWYRIVLDGQEVKGHFAVRR